MFDVFMFTHECTKWTFLPDPETPNKHVFISYHHSFKITAKYISDAKIQIRFEDPPKKIHVYASGLGIHISLYKQKTLTTSCFQLGHSGSI